MPSQASSARPANAASILSLCHARLNQDFHTLSTDQVDLVLHYADEARYRKPASANGSRARYFYARLQRLARRQARD